MRNKIILIVIVFIGLVSNISPQQKFRKAAYLTQSVGTHIYNHAGASTNVQAELTAYNTAHGYTGENTCTINLDPTSPDDYPPGGNQIWKWWDAFRDAPGYSFKENYLDTDTYDIIMIKHCFASQVGIWFWWYEGPQDTINYPQTQSDYNYQWYARKILKVMEAHPEKYFVWWDMPPALSDEGSAADMQRLADFNLWMTDTLQAGLDSYGAFPPNVKIFDYFNLLDSANFMPVSLADSPTDSHPNAHASEIVAPILVQRMFDAAIAYEESLLPVELSSFSASIIGSTVKLNWKTETELNNYGFEIERASTSHNQGWTKIGFVKGNGNSNSPKYYSFVDNNLTAGKYSYRLTQIDTDGQFDYSEVVEVEFNSITNYTLEQNYPNPFNPSTAIKYRISGISFVTLKVYDVLGNEITTLINEEKPIGSYEVEFDATGLTSGIYFYKLQASSFVETKKMILMK